MQKCDTVTQAGITQAEVARAIGVTRSQISKDVANGMPLTSLQDAKNWRAHHKSEGIGHKGVDSGVTAAVQASSREVASSGDEGYVDPLTTLERMKDIETRQYALWAAAMRRAKKTQSASDYAVLPGLMRAYNQAGNNALEAAKAWERHARATGSVAPVEHLMNVLESRLSPLAAQLKSFARKVAAQANPAAPEVAEAAIQAALEPLLRQIASGTDPIPAAPEGDASAAA